MIYNGGLISLIIRADALEKQKPGYAEYFCIKEKFSSKYRNLIRLINSSEVYFWEQNEKNSVIYSEKDFEDVRFILEVIKEIIDFLNSI